MDDLVKEEHEGYDLYRPKNLPANRHPLAHEMVIRVWMVVTVSLVLLGAGMVWYIA